ncbi:MAG: hypothetical protein GF398_13790 [Chitinivibrionales bacterium]|nr:hypothetical protein [Chitinivibrionales bacterium]
MASMNERGSDRIEQLNSDTENRTFFDLSTTGVCCLYDKALNKGAQVTVSLNDILLAAKVAYSVDRTDGYRIGLQFLKIPPQSQAEVDSVVEKYSRGVPVACRIMDAK